MIGADGEFITDPGLTLYWVVFGLMAGSALGFSFFVFLRPVTERSHGYCTMTIVTIASIAYYAMAAWGGSVPQTTYTDRGVARPIYWARYVDWFFTTPLLLTDLLLMAGVPFGDWIWIVFADVIMILTGLFGATSSHRFKWGWFGISCFFLALVNIGMLYNGTKHAFLRGKRIGTLYLGLATYLCVAWWGYPIVWGLAEGSNTITPNEEAFSYGGLDIATKVIFGWFIILVMGPILRRQNEEEYARGKYLPQLLGAPINGLLSPYKTDLTYPSGQNYTNQAAAEIPGGGGAVPHAVGLNGNGHGNGVGNPAGTNKGIPGHTDSHLGPPQIHS